MQSLSEKTTQLRRGLTRRWTFSQTAAQMRGGRAGLRQRLGGPKPVRLLILSDGEIFTSEQQIAPLMRHAPALARRFGLLIRHLPLKAAMSRPLPECDALAFKLSFRTPPQEAARIAQTLRHALPARRPLIYLDGDDDLGVQYPQVLATCDGWIKKHVFAGPERYLEPRIGKTNLTDHVARHHGTSFEQDFIPRSAPLDPALLPRVTLGWNIALDDPITHLAEAPRSEIERDIDVSCRAMVPPDSWIAPLRAPAVAAIEALSARYRVSARQDRVPRAAYIEELQRSRISVSPFGFGEICWRDFEVMLCGALLIKPDMGHLRTAPDLFRPFETYVPCAWDFSDLGEICDRYLSDPEAARRIARRAETELRAALAPKTTMQLLVGALHEAGVPGLSAS